MPAPATSSRHLYTGHRQGHTQAAPWLRASPSGRAFVPGKAVDPGSDATVQSLDASAVVHTRSSSRRTPDPLTAGLLRSRFSPRLLTDMTLRWFGSPACTANPEGQPPSLAQHGRAGDLLHRHHFLSGHTPLEIDCRFQTICEGCGFFETDVEFVPILRRQRDDATAHADLARTKLYDDLIGVIDHLPGRSTA